MTNDVLIYLIYCLALNGVQAILELQKIEDTLYPTQVMVSTEHFR